MQSQVSIEKHVVVEDRDLDELLEQAIARLSTQMVLLRAGPAWVK